jgi:hypothetical protein
MWGGASGARGASGGGGSVSCFESTETTLVPPNAGSPVSIS